MRTGAIVGVPAKNNNIKILNETCWRGRQQEREYLIIHNS